MGQKRTMTKSSTGSFTSDTGSVEVIDRDRLPDQLVIQVKTQIECDCPRCGHTSHPEVVVKIDIARHVHEAVRKAIVGAFRLPPGSYEALAVFGHAGNFLSGVMRRLG